MTGNALAGPPRHLDEDKVARYAHILDQLPPVVVFDLVDGLLLVDGYPGWKLPGGSAGR